MTSPAAPSPPPGSPAPDGAKARADSWTWAVRVYRTRSLAGAACRAGHVSVNGEKAKPSSPVRVGDEVRARTDAGERILVVRRVLTKRVSAPLAAEAVQDLTPPPPPRTEVPLAPMRERGAGRPTKRERRQIDELRGREAR
ncbi:RNA-binding S4 domain-containing protein [Sanguibacter hominis ATCC BAA-789]|uniref:RNA-binding S4 domain-containing protein n=1 Tax=Sanguibacter hominis ATCC BAA-789 TaxID=1312740 RepID=A0A9X5INB2_9MICO|nr:RNA-binding S4 domain-containing protein [Sanguibacter hominis ATCC BAA-789]